ATEVPRLAARLGAPLVTHAQNFEPGARRREARVANALARDGILVENADAASVQPPGTVHTGSGAAYVVYGPFAGAWAARPLPAAAATPRFWMPADGLPRGVAVDAHEGDGLPAAGEAAARARLSAFLRDGLGAYAERRDFPGEDATSRLSYHLRFGTLSAADACRRVGAAVARRPARK